MEAKELPRGFAANTPASLPEKEPWEMTLQQWMGCPRRLEMPAESMDVNAWRSLNGYHNPLTDHVHFNPMGNVGKAGERRFQKDSEGWVDSMVKGAAEYNRLLQEGKIPLVEREFALKADGTDHESVLAKFRNHHRAKVRIALREGLPVPAEVVADYPCFARYLPTSDDSMGPRQQFNLFPRQ